MSNTRKVIRKEVNRLLSGGQITSATVTTAGAATGLTVIDTAYKSTLLSDDLFTGDPILLTSGACDGLWRRIASFAATSGTFTVDEAFTFTADGTGVIITSTTLTDARQAWTVNSFVGYVITCDSKTMTVTSNTATVLTGASWAASDPGDGNSYSVVGAVAVGVTYELFHVLHPSRIEECVSHALRKIDYETMAIPSLLADADMEASGTTSYTAGAGATLAKDTTAANIFRQTQSLSITADATGGDDEDAYAYQQFNVVEGDTFYVWAAARNSAAATSCKLSAYDATSGAEIESETSTQLDWQILAFNFVIPEDCKLLQIRPQTMTNSGVSYWDQVQLLRGRQRRYAMPSWVTSKRQVRDTVYRAEGQELESGGGRMPDESGGERWPHIDKQVEGSTVYIRPDPPFKLGGLVFVKCLRPYAALTSDTATTDADLDWVVAKTMFECYDLLDSPQTPSDERSLFSVEKDKWARRATAFDSLFMPHPTGDWGLGGETLFRVD